MDCTVRAHSQRRAKRFNRFRRPNRDDNHFACHALFIQADSFLDGDFVEWVDAHLYVGEIDGRAVGLDTRLGVVIDHPFNGHENLHDWHPC